MTCDCHPPLPPRSPVTGVMCGNKTKLSNTMISHQYIILCSSMIPLAGGRLVRRQPVVRRGESCRLVAHVLVACAESAHRACEYFHAWGTSLTCRASFEHPRSGSDISACRAAQVRTRFKPRQTAHDPPRSPLAKVRTPLIRRPSVLCLSFERPKLAPHAVSDVAVFSPCRLVAPRHREIPRHP